MTARVVVVGDALIDELRDDNGVREFVGGAALNVAVGLTRLGVPTTLIAMVGDDEAGAHIRAYLADFGVELIATPSPLGTLAGGQHAQRRRASRCTCSTRRRRVAASASARPSRRRSRMPHIVVVSCFPFDDAAQTARARRRARGVGRAAAPSTPIRGRACCPTARSSCAGSSGSPPVPRWSRSARTTRRCSTASRSTRCARAWSTSACRPCWRRRVRRARRSRRATSS